MKFLVVLVAFLGLTAAQNLTSFSFPSGRQVTEACGSVSNAFCITERQFVACGPTTEDNRIYTCPLAGQFCADVVGSCTADTTVPKTSNTVCDTCSTVEGKGHTCTSYDTFETCTDGVFARTDANRCRPGTFCDAFSANPDNPCSSFSGRQLLCWKSLEPIPEKSDKEACEELGEGRFPLLEDSSCRTFLACEQDTVTKTWYASRLTCQPPNVFWPDLEVCVPPFLYSCPGTPPGARRISITASLNPNSLVPLR